jgi:hypothetical protein
VYPGCRLIPEVIAGVRDFRFSPKASFRPMQFFPIPGLPHPFVSIGAPAVDLVSLSGMLRGGLVLCIFSICFESFL